MSAPARRLATWEDILAMGEDVHAEILCGELTIHANPTWEHSQSQAATNNDLFGPFSRGRGGPGGWWILPELDVALGTGDILRPDLTGIRKARFPVLPKERPLPVDPDFVCEILSPSNRTYDLTDKRAAYHAAGVSHLWYVDPYDRYLEAFRHSPEGYVLIATGRDGQVLRIPPFEAIEIVVSDLLPPMADSSHQEG